MNIFKSKKSDKVWGSSQPKQLVEIAIYLRDNGFTGPTPASTVYSLEFTRKINAELNFSCSINRLYEDPHGVFNFQTYLGLSSIALRNDVDAAMIWETPICDVKNKSVYVFSIGLQDLKWDAEGGDINPVWQVSVQPEYSGCANDWIADWARYAAPIVTAINDDSSAIKFCYHILNYKKNPWVKSDGFTSPALEIYTAMLLVRNQQVEEARALLTDVLGITTRDAKKIQLHRTIDWIELTTQGKNQNL